jgi:membrane-bound serine protease (ClpP class)
VVFVSPPGAWAGSAGCFITLAADLAAMAPGTSIGAAHPVGLGPDGGKQDEVMKQKLANFSSSYIEAIAAKRHRNTVWARDSVQNSAAITAEKALELKVIEFVARDLPDLLAQIHGREINGRKLATAGATVVDIPMTVRERVFQVFAHPQVMLVLMLIVMYGVIGELTSPGAILPGVAGVIALVLLMYLGSILPMNTAGLALVAVAIGLFIIDVFTPTHGVLTAGGILAFFLGTFMLFDRSEAFLRLSLAWVLPATVVTALFFIFIVSAGIRAQRMPSKSGPEAWVGQVVTALEPIDSGRGRVFLEGEYWNALSTEPVAAGQAVEIIALEGLTLKVQPLKASREVRS